MASSNSNPNANAKKTRPRVIIVDDHPIVRQGLGQLIEQESDLAVCAEADNVQSALEEIDRTKPDVAVVDLVLKDSSGLDLVKALRSRYPGLPVLVVSMHDEVVYAERALRSGALGYIMKEEATTQVFTALRKVLAGEVYLSERMVNRILRRLVGGNTAVGLESLSDRELEVFQWIGLGLSVNDIATKLSVSPKTIESFRSHIKEKLGLSSANEVARFATQWFQKGSPDSAS
jgi:DNA-binding NarL/FixJ family response regulator